MFLTAPGCSRPNQHNRQNKATVYAGGLTTSRSKARSTTSNPTPARLGIRRRSSAWHLSAPRACFAHTLIKGNVEWGIGSALDPSRVGSGTLKGDYHDYFEIEVSPSLPLISSRLVFFGNENQKTKVPDDFITNGTSCPGSVTTWLTLENKEKIVEKQPYSRPLSLENCGAVPFEPGFALTPTELVHDQPDGFATEVTVNHEPKRTIDNSEVKTVTRPAPRRHDAEPVGGRRPDRVYRKTGSDPQLHDGHRMSRQLGTRDREPRSPDAPRGIAQRQPLSRRPRIRARSPGPRTRCTSTRSRPGTASRCV